jgi:hypothetical protein
MIYANLKRKPISAVFHFLSSDPEIKIKRMNSIFISCCFNRMANAETPNTKNGKTRDSKDKDLRRI